MKMKKKKNVCFTTKHESKFSGADLTEILFDATLSFKTLTN